MAPPAATIRERWMRLQSVAAGNGEGDDLEAVMNGDKVGVVTLFDVKEETRSAMHNIGIGADAGDEGRSIEAKIREIVGSRSWRADIRSNEWIGYAFAEALELPLQGDDDTAARNRERIKIAIRDWFDRKLLREKQRPDKDYKLKIFIELTEQNSPQDIRQDIEGGFFSDLFS